MSTRPSHDNVINALGVNMSAALDQILTVQEQSYDEFLDEFTYLNKDELKKDMLNPPKRKTEISKVDKSKKTDEKSQQHDKILSDKGNSETDKASAAEEELEEEILVEGEKTSIMSQKAPTGSDITSKLKFDNFVINEDTEDDAKCDENDDEFILDGYEASFYSNWKIGSSDKTSAGGLEEVETKDEYEADIDGLLQDNSENSKLIEIPVHFENKECQVTCAEQERNPASQTVSIIDSNSTLSRLDLQRECDSSSEILSYTDRVGLPPIDSSLNPGEVEDPGSPRVINMKDQERILDFSATYRTEMVSTSHTSEECSDEVTAFSLDEDFDYDNVVLTPKFSVEEVAFLRSCRT